MAQADVVLYTVYATAQRGAHSLGDAHLVLWSPWASPAGVSHQVKGVFNLQ